VSTNLLAVKSPSAWEKQVQVSIEVKIDKTDTVAECLEDRVFPRFSTVTIGEIHSQLVGDLYQHDLFRLNPFFNVPAASVQLRFRALLSLAAGQQHRQHHGYPLARTLRSYHWEWKHVIRVPVD
jgi:hypothetical protein